MRTIAADEIDRVLTYPALVEALRAAFRGDITVPVRHHHAIGNFQAGRRNLSGNGYRGSAALSQRNAIAYVYRHTALKIGKAKGLAAVAAVGGAQDGKQSLVLINRQQLPIAESPAFGRKVPTDDLDFAKEWL